MAINPEKICLLEAHHFHVTVKDGKQRFAGKLTLSSERVTLMVTGEEYEERRCTLAGVDIDSLICTNLNAKFLLLGLQCKSDMGSVIEHIPKSISYFEVHFEVENVVYFPKGMPSYPTFLGIELKFGALSNWLGNTHNQEKIIQEYASGARITEKPELFEEFTIQIEKEGDLGVHYSPTRYYSSPTFSAGIDFPPSLYCAFQEQKEPAQTIQFFSELRILFEFLVGGELDIEEVVFHYRSGPFIQKASLFYPNAKHHTSSHHSVVLYPLSRNLRFDTRKLPEFPITSFNSYFRLPEKERAYFHKYIKYRRVNSSEERFLGYFRILESLCRKTGNYIDSELLCKLTERSEPFLLKYFGDRKAVKAFLTRLPAFNNSKYNAEKCIGDFLKTVPPALSSMWVYQKSDLAKICQLRNDISHANDYQIPDDEIEKMCKFCEVLLVIALFLKLDVNMDSAVAVIGRMDGYHLATRPKA